MKIGFRVDSSFRIGAGHLMRCLALAETLRSRGAHIVFISRDYPGNALAALKRRGFASDVLRGRDDVVSAEALDGAWEEDARESVHSLMELREPVLDWLVVDHYGLDVRWEQRMKAQARRILVIDDLANRNHEADVLLDQNLYPGMLQRYDAHVGATCVRLLGPRYALLRPEFRRARLKRARFGAREKRLCISLGNSDPTNTTSVVLKALRHVDLGAWSVDVIVGGANAAARDIIRLARQIPRCDVCVDPQNVAAVVANAQFAVGAPGVSLWERSCLGVPSLVVAQADNQVPIAEAAAHAGLAKFLGRAPHVQSSALIRAIRGLMTNTPARIRAARHVAARVDGLGTARVARLMLSLARRDAVKLHTEVG